MRAGTPLLHRRGAAHAVPATPPRRALRCVGGQKWRAFLGPERTCRGLHRHRRRRRHRRLRRSRRRGHRTHLDGDRSGGRPARAARTDPLRRCAPWRRARQRREMGALGGRACRARARVRAGGLAGGCRSACGDHDCDTLAARGRRARGPGRQRPERRGCSRPATRLACRDRARSPRRACVDRDAPARALQPRRALQARVPRTRADAARRDHERDEHRRRGRRRRRGAFSGAAEPGGKRRASRPPARRSSQAASPLSPTPRPRRSSRARPRGSAARTCAKSVRAWRFSSTVSAPDTV